MASTPEGPEIILRVIGSIKALVEAKEEFSGGDVPIMVRESAHVVLGIITAFIFEDMTEDDVQDFSELSKMIEQIGERFPTKMEVKGEKVVSAWTKDNRAYVMISEGNLKISASYWEDHKKINEWDDRTATDHVLALKELLE